ncbi:MAG: ATP-dependent Clp protease proteolytic subunit [Pseudonocardiaceae bacterium]
MTLTGRLDAEAANRAAASLDTLDLMGVPVHATCLGGLTGAAVAILAVADHRTAGAHATLHLREPHAQHCGHARDVTAHAEDHQRRLRLLQERIAGVCRHSIEAVVADMRAGRILTAEEARDYGLVDAVAPVKAQRRSG